jgi:hypothetical protein
MPTQKRICYYKEETTKNSKEIIWCSLCIEKVRTTSNFLMKYYNNIQGIIKSDAYG